MGKSRIPKSGAGACGSPAPPIKPGQQFSETGMAILAIVIFIGAIAVLNRVEFGRFD